MLTPAQKQTLVRLYREDGADPNYNRTGFEFPIDCEKVKAYHFVPLLIAGLVEVKDSRLHVTTRGREMIAMTYPEEWARANSWDYSEPQPREYS